MVDAHRFSKRSRELNERAQILENLAKLPNRATENDLRQAASMMRGAANHLEELVAATPPGCICRHVENDNYSYLDYAEACLHHRQLYILRESLKKDYAKMERQLKDEVRMKLVAAALTGTASMPRQEDPGGKNTVEKALMLADAAIRRITETA